MNSIPEIDEISESLIDKDKPSRSLRQLLPHITGDIAILVGSGIVIGYGIELINGKSAWSFPSFAQFIRTYSDNLVYYHIGMVCLSNYSRIRFGYDSHGL